MLIKSDKPQKAIVHNSVKMLLDRLFSEKTDKCALIDLLVSEQIAVDTVALIGIARPNPSVSFDAIKKCFSAIEMEGMHGDRAYVVKASVIALKFSLLYKGKVLKARGYLEL